MVAGTSVVAKDIIHTRMHPIRTEEDSPRSDGADICRRVPMQALTGHGVTALGRQRDGPGDNKILAVG